VAASGVSILRIMPELHRFDRSRRLRIADASLMPSQTTGNTNPQTIMIGEKISDAILGRQLPPSDAPFAH